MARAARWTRPSASIARRSTRRERQGARWLELRAARGYAHHLVEHGRAAEARDLLQPIVAWFTEGRETMDYLYAEGLLRTLD